MNSFLELLKQRRSIRQFSSKPVEQKKIDIIVESMLRSPSSRGLDPWEFIVVNDSETINSLATAKTHGAAFLSGAPLAIVICADPQKSDVWVEDTSIASLIVHLAATDIDLGSCWVQIRLREHAMGGSAEDYVKKVVGIPNEKVVEAIIAIGYAKEKKDSHPVENLLRERVSYNKYGNIVT